MTVDPRPPILEKENRLIRGLSRLGSVLIAYSGGVDSTYLLAAARDVPGLRVEAAIARSAVHPEREMLEAMETARRIGIRPHVLASRELEDPLFLRNERDRCYHCKRRMLSDLLEVAKRLGISHVAHGANRDDLNDFRPGSKAAAELGVLAPLVDAGLGKADIRALSKHRGLPTWDKPAMACLASRIPYGRPLDPKELARVDAAENVLRDHGFAACRVRLHDAVARIEVDPEHFGRWLDEGLRTAVVSALLELGFLHVALDLEGYRQGSMNRQLPEAAGDAAPADGAEP